MVEPPPTRLLPSSHWPRLLILISILQQSFLCYVAYTPDSFCLLTRPGNNLFPTYFICLVDSIGWSVSAVEMEPQGGPEEKKKNRGIVSSIVLNAATKVGIVEQTVSCSFLSTLSWVRTFSAWHQSSRLKSTSTWPIKSWQMDWLNE